MKTSGLWVGAATLALPLPLQATATLFYCSILRRRTERAFRW